MEKHYNFNIMKNISLSLIKKTVIVAALWLVSTTMLAVNVTHLTTEYMKNPLGIDVSHPRFAWQMQSDRYGAAQTAYRLVVASSLSDLEKGSYVYDTGKVKSSSSVGIAYGGDVLRPSTRYYWKVTVWDEKGVSTDSQSDWFETGLLGSSWHNAMWIGSQKYILSKYRGRFVIDYDFLLQKKSNRSVFLFGAKSESDCLSLTIETSKAGTKLLFGHIAGGTSVVDNVEDITAVIPADKKTNLHHVNLAVSGARQYDVAITIDGQCIKCSKTGKESFVS